MPWTPLLDAAALEPNQILSVSVGELDLVVWRGATGNTVVMEARCPHEWSHLGAEGFVDGDEIVCAAHFWRFDRSGCGTKVNVKGRRDPKSDIQTFACREIDGTIEAEVTGA